MTAAGRGRPRGRRSGQPDTREVILNAARVAFADRGFDAVSVRQIAEAAGVDSALIHHYFGSKDKLFIAAVQFPADPAQLIGAIADGPIDGLGSRVVETFLATWEDATTGPALEALVRSALANNSSQRLVREFFAVQIIGQLMEKLPGDIDPDEIPIRAGLVASQLFGLAVARQLLQFEPLHSTPRARLVTAIGPTIQRYLTGEIGESGQ